MHEQDQQQDRTDETRPRAGEAERVEPGRMYGAAAAGRLDAIGPTAILALQRSVGNAAVTQLIQRALAGPEAPSHRLTAQRSPGDETNIGNQLLEAEQPVQRCPHPEEDQPLQRGVDDGIDAEEDEPVQRSTPASAGAQDRNGTVGQTTGSWDTGLLDALGPAGLLDLQRTIGNAAVTHLIQRSLPASGSSFDGQSATQEQQPRSPVLDVVGKGGGEPLDDALREEMETRMGDTFDDVRVHTDAQAKASAKAVQAKAYTVGNEIVLGEGVDPHSAAGKRTYAHELTHVQQQRSGPVEGTPTGGGVAISDPADRYEQAAEANATQVMNTPLPAAQRCPGNPPPEEDPSLQRCAEGTDTDVQAPDTHTIGSATGTIAVQRQGVGSLGGIGPGLTATSMEQILNSMQGRPASSGTHQGDFSATDPAHASLAGQALHSAIDDIECAKEDPPDPATDPYVMTKWDDASNDWIVGGRPLNDASKLPSYSLSQPRAWPVTQIINSARGHVWDYPGFPTPCYLTHIDYDNWSDRKNFKVTVTHYNKGESAAKAAVGIGETLMSLNLPIPGGRGLKVATRLSGYKSFMRSAGKAMGAFKKATGEVGEPAIAHERVMDKAGVAANDAKTAGKTDPEIETAATSAAEQEATRIEEQAKLSAELDEPQAWTIKSILDEHPQGPELRRQAAEIVWEWDQYSLPETSSGLAPAAADLRAQWLEDVDRVAFELQEGNRDQAVNVAKKLGQKRNVHQTQGLGRGGVLVPNAAKTTPQDVRFDNIATQLDAQVQHAYQQVFDDPLGVSAIDAHTKRFADTYAEWLNSANDPTKRAKLEQRMPREFGYAVESVATHLIGPNGANLQTASHMKIDFQASYGHTRPDIVVTIDDGLPSKAEGWFDITADKSEGHIQKKDHSGWKTRPYVSEITYPSLDSKNMQQLGAKSNSPQAQANRATITAASQAQAATWQAQLSKARNLVPDPDLNIGNMKNRVKDLVNKLRKAFNDPLLSPGTAKSILEVTATTPGKYGPKDLNLGDYGFKGSANVGADINSARQVIYALP